MSYVERATYDFFKKAMTDGVKVLFSSKFVLFSILLTLTAFASASLSFAFGSGTEFFGIVADESLIRLLIAIEISLSIVFIFIGIFNRLIKSKLLKSVIMLVLWITLSGIGLLEIESGNTGIITSSAEYISIICLFIWVIFVPITSLWASFGLFYSKITGSILFLGKPEDNHNAIFSGIMAFIAVIGTIFAIYLYNLSFVTISVIIIILSVLVFLVVRGKIIKNDAFNSMIGFYYIMLIPTMILLVYSELNSGSNDAVSVISYLIITFSILYSAQGVVKKFKEDKMEKLAKELAKSKNIDEKDPFFLGRIVSLIGGDGLVIIILGTILGYHALQIQMYTSNFSSDIKNDLFISIFENRTVSQVSQQLTIAVATILVIVLLLGYYIFPHIRSFYKTEGRIYRFGFLPDYDSMIEFFKKYQGGEISWPEIMAKAAVLGTKKGSSAAAGGFISLLNSGRSKFRRSKKK